MTEKFFVVHREEINIPPWDPILVTHTVVVGEKVDCDGCREVLEDTTKGVKA